MDVPGLTRLRACPAYDDLTAVEHVAVLDAAELLDELRPQGYGFTLLRSGPLRVAPPVGADKEAKARIAALAPALAYVLRLEADAAPLPDACRACGVPVWQYTPSGDPACERHFRIAKARALLALADADLERRRREREAAAARAAPARTGRREGGRARADLVARGGRRVP
jgi:hypothetical protein